MNQIITATLALLLLSPASKPAPSQSLLPNHEVLHVGIIVHDIEQSVDQWMLLLGETERPNIILAAGHESVPTHYHGHPTDAKAHLAFFSLDNIRVELIEPLGEADSDWHRFLEERGEGVHHLAFEVKDIQEVHMASFETAGMPVVQYGGWGTGEYGYCGSEEALGVVVELIEHYQK